MKEEKERFDSGHKEDDGESSNDTIEEGTTSTNGSSTEGTNTTNDTSGVWCVNEDPLFNFLDNNPKGPISTLISAGMSKKVHLLYEKATLKVICAFVKHILRHMIGVREWKMNCGANRKMHEFVSTSDEAFALLVLENNAEKWHEQVTEPDLKKSEHEGNCNDIGCEATEM